MATKKITELVEITAAANDDVLPIVDISTDITNKIKVENLPISNDVQTALNAKEDLTNKSTSVTTDQASDTKYPSVKAVYDWAVGLFATLTQLATKQDTLVSGTNIKTVNSTSLLGSGDIPIPIVNPSGGAGAIQFSDGSAFASDSNLFWDNTNKRLGVGTSSPTHYLTINESGTRLNLSANGTFNYGLVETNRDFLIFTNNNVVAQRVHKDGVQIGVTSGSIISKLHIKGSGTTSATTALLVQNSAGTNALTVRDDGVVVLGVSMSGGNISTNFLSSGGLIIGNSNPRLYQSNATNANLSVNFTGIVASTSGYSSSTASAVLEATSTTQGFLPPRMTTTQKNAISSPASGLQVYDTDLNQMSYYNGSSWINF